MDRAASLQHIVTFCGRRERGCPELFLDHNAPPERHVVIADDYGQHIQMSVAQLRDIVAAAKDGSLDALQEPARG
ncbi:hypothetical protein CLV30_103160 [Haloactinopolyspora alba]|uniref:Uncharacterized protein n=1 Tax=Haloactinopolyspora alba TaxID=648780 RepID=A0A2P8E953_9ACTN|nr:hypothetical protein [Haloactinopolyspora alba]PSL06006.1 hypothetical protein CLV30_103160 [Haloactinopolyspora alba]